jgi:signal transduction histidine kinase
MAFIREKLLELAGTLRGVCNELRPPETIRFGLAKAIQYQSEEIKEKIPDLVIHHDLAQDGERLPVGLRTALFRIYQECMNNVIRHAQASEVTVRFLFDQSSALLEVEDNGIGFESPSDWVELARNGHFGLVGMRERSESIGGQMEVCSGENGGTIVRVEVPVRE